MHHNANNDYDSAMLNVNGSTVPWTEVFTRGSNLGIALRYAPSPTEGQHVTFIFRYSERK